MTRRKHLLLIALAGVLLGIALGLLLRHKLPLCAAVIFTGFCIIVFMWAELLCFNSMTMQEMPKHSWWHWIPGSGIYIKLRARWMRRKGE